MPSVYLSATPSTSTTPTTFLLRDSTVVSHSHSKDTIPFDDYDALPDSLPLPSSSATPSSTVPFAPTPSSTSIRQPSLPTRTILVDPNAISGFRAERIAVPPMSAAQGYYIHVQIQASSKPSHIAIGLGVGAGTLVIVILGWVAVMHWRFKRHLREHHSLPSECKETDPLTRPPRSARNSSISESLIRPYTIYTVSQALRSSSCFQSRFSTIVSSAIENGELGRCTPPPSYAAQAASDEEEDGGLVSATTQTPTSTTTMVRKDKRPRVPSLRILIPPSAQLPSRITSAISSSGMHPPAYCDPPVPLFRTGP